jgi:hypothetical protein
MSATVQTHAAAIDGKISIPAPARLARRRLTVDWAAVLLALAITALIRLDFLPQIPW